jgi:N-acetylglucosaminyl-diphospho-decaprenol L-rhamnosyltransferase
MSPSRATVAVVSFDTCALLDRCLTSLRGVGDVWVVDNGSSDGSAEMVRSRHPWASLVVADENLGFGRAVNLVARRTSSEWLVAANADVAVEPGALDVLLGAARPRDAALAPALVLPDGSVQRSVFPFPTAREAVARAAGRDAWRSFDLSVEGVVPWAVGAFLAVRREAFDAVGGFDEAQWMYAEDLDLGWRLARRGWTTRYVPSARVLHEEAASTSAAFGDDRTERWQRATYAWIARRRGAPRARAVAAINAASASARAAVSRGAARERWRWWADLHRRAVRG